MYELLAEQEIKHSQKNGELLEFLHIEEIEFSFFLQLKNTSKETNGESIQTGYTASTPVVPQENSGFAQLKKGYSIFSQEVEDQDGNGCLFARDLLCRGNTIIPRRNKTRMLISVSGWLVSETFYNLTNW